MKYRQKVMSYVQRREKGRKKLNTSISSMHNHVSSRKTLTQTYNHSGIPPLSFLQAGCPSLHTLFSNIVIHIQFVQTSSAEYVILNSP